MPILPAGMSKRDMGREILGTDLLQGLFYPQIQAWPKQQIFRRVGRQHQLGKHHQVSVKFSDCLSDRVYYQFGVAGNIPDQGIKLGHHHCEPGSRGS